MFSIVTMVFLLIFDVFIPNNIPAFERLSFLLLIAGNLGLAFTFANSKRNAAQPMSSYLGWNSYAYVVILAVVGSLALMRSGHESIAILTISLVFIGQLLAIQQFAFSRDLGERKAGRVRSGRHLSAEGLISLLPSIPSDAADLHTLCQKTGLEEIVLKDKKLASIDLSPLSSFTGFKVLDLSQNRLTEIDLSPLSSCASLENLNLWLNRIETLDLSPLKSCIRLRELNLMDNRLTQIDLEPLRSCKEFEYLELSGNRISAIDLSPLSAFNKFNALNISVEMEEPDLTPLSSCRQLRILTIDGRGMKRLDLTPLSTCGELDFLMVDSTESIILDITPLFNCSKLTRLQASGVELVAAELMKHHDWPVGLKKYRKSVQFY
ncbi:MAG: leucine-rich repeat domain-containing protein [Candidatus Thorarchaeota archaeon]|jgi:hypothetical protein